MPVTPDGALRHAQRLGNLRLRQASEVPHLDDVSEARIDNRQALEGLVDAEDLLLARRGAGARNR